MPALRPDEIPSEKEIKARLKRWFKYAVDEAERRTGAGKSWVAEHMGMSLGHIANVYNHEHRGVGIRFMVCMHYGLDITLRELIHEDPETPTRAQTTAAEPSPPRVGRARKRA